MRIIFSYLLVTLVSALNLLGQTGEVKELISQGVGLHDQGKFNEAIAKYKAALAIDSKSSLANYELAFSSFLNKQYDSAIKYSRIALEINTSNQHESYIVLGNSLDVTGKPIEAIKTYEDALKKFSKSNLLNYNLALTCYNEKDYTKAEKAAINAVMAKPDHGSSHIILATIMMETGQRIKSVLPMYYFLMLEPASKRSPDSYATLKKQLGQGVEKKDDKNININISSSKDDDFGAAELMLGLLAASKYTEGNEKKNDMEMFVETTNGLFSVLGELKGKKNKGLWWDFYVTKFYDLVQSKNDEAFTYYISQSINAESVNKWINANPEKMQRLTEWMKQ